VAVLPLAVAGRANSWIGRRALDAAMTAPMAASTTPLVAMPSGSRRSHPRRSARRAGRSKVDLLPVEGHREATGLPEPMARELNSRTWYEHAVAYVDMKWPRASAKHRKGIAEALAGVTPALLASDRGAPADKDIRRELYTWTFNKTRRDAGPPPERVAPAIRWLEANTVKLSALADPALVRKALDALATRQDGKAAAATTVARKRAVFFGALRYGVELGHFDTHPMDRVSWIAPKTTEEIDRQVVANPRQARALLAAVRKIAPELEAFFTACTTRPYALKRHFICAKTSTNHRSARVDGDGFT
jgi:hypothetical protein